MAWVTPPTFVANDPLAAADLNILGDDLVYLKGITDGVSASGTQVYRTANQTIATSSATNVTYTTEAFDYGGWWAAGASITVPAGAIPSGFTSILVMAVGRVLWVSNATGTRRLRVLLNGTSFGSQTLQALTADATDQTLTDFTLAVAGDVITWEVYQTSGGNLDVDVAVMTVLRFAPAA